MKNWVIRMVNSNSELAQLELNTLLNDCKLKWLTGSMAWVTCTEKRINEVFERSFRIKYVLSCPIVVEYQNLLKKNNAKLIEKLACHLLSKDIQTFAVRFHHIEKEHKSVETLIVERNLGSWVFEANSDINVDLKNPDKQLIAISWGPKAAIGWLEFQKKFNDINWRAPKFTPYSRGGGMKPRLCRTLVNLHGELSPLMLDPFCGHGGILREMADLGKFAIGIEISKKVCFEMLDNNKITNYDGKIAPIMGDALNSPFRKNAISQVVTDPPYAIQTTTKGEDREELVKKWLDLQDFDQQVVISLPDSVLRELPANWTLDLDVSDYVHGSLTRRIRKISKER